MNPILGIDFGHARIGLAISDDLQLLAHPLETLRFGPNVMDRIVQIVSEKKIERVIVGIPKLMSGKLGQAAIEAQQFAEKLRERLPCEVITWDERLTTVAANRALRDAGKKTRNTRAYVDQVAAQMILQGYLDRQQAAAVEEPRG